MGGRDISVQSVVLTLGWGLCGFVGLVCLTSSRSSSGLLFSAGGFASRVPFVCVCVAWRIWFSMGERTSV